MDAITLNAIINSDNQLIVDLPANLPKGPVKLTIEPINAPAIESEELTLEEMRARLAASGLLVTDFSFLDDPELDDLQSLSEEELDELTRDIPVGRSTEDLVNEDRGDY